MMKNVTAWTVWPWLLIVLMSCQTSENEREPEAAEEVEEFRFYRPAEALDELFHEVQMRALFEDSKTFVDSRARRPPAEILADYRHNKEQAEFELARFVERNFEVPDTRPVNFELNSRLSMEEHIRNHWDYLARDADNSEPWSSLIPLPYSYVVPGGRFREIYYWDSYFTMRGLAASNRDQMVKAMLDNFAWMAEHIGHIPNGNRTYYLSRSQPPFFAAMVSLYAEQAGMQAAAAYLPQLEQEYEFWMRGAAEVEPGEASLRVVRMADGSVLNRYYDSRETPRPESYREDRMTAETVSQAERPQLYRDIRAAAESGWDFSSRWFGDCHNLATIQTTAIVPVDLNSLLFHLEQVIAELAAVKGDEAKAARFRERAAARREAVDRWLWDASVGAYRDRQFEQGEFTRVLSLAMVYPLYFQLASPEQAAAVSNQLRDHFLMDGGLVTSLTSTGEQWDAPNGWAPLQWLAIRGLDHYGHRALSLEVAQRWLKLNRRVFRNTGRMMEKYNVVDTTLLAGGGEYPLQDGFGWTNGVVLAIADWAAQLEP